MITVWRQDNTFSIFVNFFYFSADRKKIIAGIKRILSLSFYLEHKFFNKRAE